MRSKCLGNTNGELGSERGAPVPFDLGRPAPSWAVNLALKSWAPYWISCGMETVNSSPSCKCTRIATSRPICEVLSCPEAAIADSNNRTTRRAYVPRLVLVIKRAPSPRGISRQLFLERTLTSCTNHQGQVISLRQFVILQRLRAAAFRGNWRVSRRSKG